MKQMLKAMATAARVSDAVVAQRIDACERCDRVIKGRLTMKCGICGCFLRKRLKGVANLAGLEENLPGWGCKHPKRGQPKPDGSGVYGWPTPAPTVNTSSRVPG